MTVVIVFAAFAILSVLLLAWQTLAAARFPLHERPRDLSFAPAVLVLKPLKGADQHTPGCLRSWFCQSYSGSWQILFGVADEDDPACAVVRSLLAEFPLVHARLVITPESLGANAKVSNLIQLYRTTGSAAAGSAGDFLVCISDADIRVPPDFLASAVAPLRDPAVGLVNSFYQLANPQNSAMEIEAVAINADFWSQVLQANTLKPQDFALGAVMLTRSAQLEAIGGFKALADYLADDYELGHRIAKRGARIVLSPVVVQCWDPPLSFRSVWAHQLRWARTIRASQPLPYFFSVLNNVTLWATAFALAAATQGVYRIAKGYPWHVDTAWLLCAAMVWACCLVARFVAARYCVQRLTGRLLGLRHVVLAAAKDFLQVGVWAAAFLGNTVTWRGRRFRVLRGGKLVPLV